MAVMHKYQLNLRLMTDLRRHTNDPVAMLPGRLESLMEEPLELPESITIHSPKNLDIVEREFERRRLEPDIAW